ncbi:MAG: GMC family oxidoreductase [Endozoicomonas sp.]
MLSPKNAGGFRNLLKRACLTTLARSFSLAITGLTLSTATLAYDFVVVGSGAGGGPLAAGLARAGHEVLLLEAGRNRGNLLSYQVPIFNASASEDPELAWNFHVNHYRSNQRAFRDSKLMCTDGIGLAQVELKANGTYGCPSTHPYRQGSFFPRGSTLGGSTAVNAMIYVLPQNSDWDRIARITGDNSWQASNMMKYADHVQQQLSIETENPDTTLEAQGNEFKQIIHSAIDTLKPDNLPPNASPRDALSGNLNEAVRKDQAEGIWPVASNIRLGQRMGSREIILEAACMADLDAPNPKTQQQVNADCEASGLVNPETGKPYLTVKTGAFVTRILWKAEPRWNNSLGKMVCEGDCKKAVGVEYINRANVYAADNNQNLNRNLPRRKVFVDKEVVLSAGFINTPQILMLSGVGPRKHIENKDIEVRQHLPGVGHNLQDRYEVAVVNQMPGVFKSIRDCAGATPQQDACLDEWQNSKYFTDEATGNYAVGGVPLSIVAKSNPTLAEPDLHIFAGPLDYRGYFNGYSAVPQPGNRWTWTILKAHTENRGGRITLRSNDPLETPIVNFNYFEDGDRNTARLQGGSEIASTLDSQALVNGIRMVRRITDNIRESGLRFRELQPGRAVHTDAELKEFIKAEAWGHHGAGTAKIGADNDPMAVLDSKFQVRGTKNLRVVDASIFPRIPGTFLVSSVYIASEKAAEVINSQYQ